MHANESPSLPAVTAANGTANRGAARFVLVFVVVVLALLAGYRYAINSPANDWFLFQVARHTSWVLDWVGYRAELEKTTRNGLAPADVRALLRGERAQAPGAIDTAPLTAWESWKYRAWNRRNNGGETGAIGPQVHFILRPGLQHEVEALEAELASLPDQGAESGQRDTITSKIQALRTAQSASAADPARRREQQGRTFSFIVIPECGAIEVMSIFLAAVLAFPARWSARAWGLGAGLPILYGVNILRLSFLAWVGAVDRGGAWFTFFHEYVWQSVYVIFVVMVWMAWVEFGVRRHAR